MPVVTHQLGPCLLTIGATPFDFTCEATAVAITHEYDEVSEARTRLCGEAVPAVEDRQDGITADLENDITAAGLYAWLQTNDLTTQPIVVQLNTTIGAVTPAQWSGDVTVKLPSEIGADEYGQPIASSIEWAAVGKLAFTPGADA